MEGSILKRQEITLLDGSIGQELVRRSGDRPTPLWSTSVMMDKPDLVAEVHGDGTEAKAYTLSDLAGQRDNLGFVQPFFKGIKESLNKSNRGKNCLLF